MKTCHVHGSKLYNMDQEMVNSRSVGEQVARAVSESKEGDTSDLRID